MIVHHAKKKTSRFSLLLIVLCLVSIHNVYAERQGPHQDDRYDKRESKDKGRFSSGSNHRSNHSSDHKNSSQRSINRRDTHKDYSHHYFEKDRHDHPNQYRRDERYQHHYYYPRRGYIVRTLPQHYNHIHFHKHDYYYFGGVWYLGNGVTFTVVAPPLGIIVSSLPSYYTTLWVNGIPYYYANDTYYVWRKNKKGYEVVTAPNKTDEQHPAELVDELFIYPKEGQSDQQLADDRFACHQWSAKQSNFDPSLPPQNLSSQEMNRRREHYQRAMRACLEGRGYSVR